MGRTVEMTPENFIHWIRGFAEMRTKPPTAEEWQAIKEHLARVTMPGEHVQYAPVILPHTAGEPWPG